MVIVGINYVFLFQKWFHLSFIYLFFFKSYLKYFELLYIVKCIKYDRSSVHRFKCFKQLLPYVRNGILFKLSFVLPTFEKKKKLLPLKKNFCLYKGKVNDRLKTCERHFEKRKKNLFLLVFVQGKSDRHFLIPFYIVCLQKVCSSQNFKVF